MLVKITFKDVKEKAKPFFNNHYSNGYIIRDDCYSYSFSQKRDDAKSAFKLIFKNGDFLSCIRGSIEIGIESQNRIIDITGDISKIELFTCGENLLKGEFFETEIYNEEYIC